MIPFDPQRGDGNTYVTGTEPWDLPKLLPDDAKLYAPFIACVEDLRVHGASALDKKQHAFWLSYQSAAKSPLVPVNNVVELDQVHIANALAAIKAAKAEEAELESTLDQTEYSLVCRSGVVGLFAKRGPIRPLALPSWCSFAVCVNTKARYWEVVATSHHAIICLNLLIPAVAKGEWQGHRYRVRQAGLPDLRNMHLVVNAISVCLK